MKRLVSFLLVLALVLSFVPTAFAAEQQAEAAPYSFALEKGHPYGVSYELYLVAQEAGPIGSLDINLPKNMTFVPAEGMGLSAQTGTDGVYHLAGVKDDGTALFEAVAGNNLLGSVSLNKALTGEDIQAMGTNVVGLPSSESTQAYYDVAVELLSTTASSHQGFTPWDGSAITQSGMYYLTQAAAVSEITVSQGMEVYVCLNGQTLSAAEGQPRLFGVEEGGSLHICDCTGSGKIVPAADGNGGFARVYSGGSLFMDGVTVDGQGVTGQANGGAITVNAGGAATLTDCVIRNCTALEGAAISVLGAVELTDCTIEANHSSKNEQFYGGAIAVDGGSLTMTGGSVKNNTGVGSVAGILVKDWVETGTSQATLKNVQITGNTVTSGGTSARAMGAAMAMMNAGTQVTLDGCTITGNTATNAAVANADYLGAVYLNNNAKLTLKGATQIRNNTAAYTVEEAATTAQSDLLANYADTIADPAWITLELAAGAHVDFRVRSARADRVTETYLNTYMLGGTLGEGVMIFTNTGDPVKQDTNGTFTLQHIHTDGYAGVAGTQVWQVWNDADALPSAAGHYYLMCDVTLSELWLPVNGTYLCLNGHTINGPGAARIMTINAGRTVTVCDCQKTGKLLGNNTGSPGVLQAANPSATANGGVVNLYDITVTSNKAVDTAQVGAIRIGNNAVIANAKNDATLNATNVTFENCFGGGGGSVAYLRYHSAANFTGCTFKDNGLSGTTRTAKGGTVWAEGDAQVTFTGCTFTGNEATNGGAVYLQNTASMVATGCTFTGNVATTNGGAIYLTGNGTAYPTVAITDSEFSLNRATNGGVIRMAGTSSKATLSATNCVFHDNSANYGAVLQMGDSSAAATASFTGCNIYKNTVRDRGTLDAGNSTVLNLTNTKITDNVKGTGTASGQETSAAGVYFGPYVKVTLSGQVVAANNAVADFQTTTIGTKKISVNGLADNSSVPVTEKTPSASTDANTFFEAGSLQTGAIQSGPISFNGQTVSYVNSTFSFDHYHFDESGSPVLYTAHPNTTSLPTTAGNWYLTGDVTLSANQALSGAAITVNVCLNGKTVTRSGTATSGRRIYTINSSSAGSTLNITDCTAVTYVDADGRKHWDSGILQGGANENGGGAIYILSNATESTKVNVSNIQFVDNKATPAKPSTSNDANNSYGGGAVHIRAGSASFTNVRFAGNTSTLNGGAVALRNQNTTLPMEVTFTGCAFEENTATVSGGAISAYPASGCTKVDVTVTDSDFTGNTATTRGGAVYEASAEVEIQGGSFSGNSATQGGAVGSTGGTVIINGASFQGNHAVTDGRGGAVAVYSATDFQAVNATFTGNYTDDVASNCYGGALYVNGAKDGSYLENCVFQDNTSDYGGAIYANCGLTIQGQNNRFAENKARVGGGAIYETSNNANVAMTETAKAEFVGNTAENSGGAIFFGAADSRFTGYNVTMTGNTAANDGGVVYLSAKADSVDVPTLTLNGGSVTGNTAAQGGAFYAMEDGGNKAKIVLNGTTVTGNTTSGDSAGVDGQDVTLSGAAVVDSLYIAGTNTAPVTASGLTEGASIGLVQGSQRTAAIFTTGGADSKYFESKSPDCLVVAVDQELALATAKVTGVTTTYYPSAKTALTASGIANPAQLLLSLETLEVTNNGYLDLCGFDVATANVAQGCTLTVLDSTTEDYATTDEEYGVIGAIQGSYAGYYNSKRYVPITQEGIGTSFHRIYVGITKYILQANDQDPNGLGFHSQFRGDEVVKQYLNGYGTRVTVKAPENGAFDPAATMYLGKDGKDFVAGKADTSHNLVVQNILTEQDTAVTNANTTIYAMPYIAVGDQVYYGKIVSNTLNSLSYQALSEASDAVKTAVNGWQSTFGILFGNPDAVAAS